MSEVSKRGFHWHFKDRSALLTEMLDQGERQGVEEVIEAVERGGGDARGRLRRLFDFTARRRDLMRTDLAVRDWARRDRCVAARLRRVDNRRMEYLREQFGEFCPDEEEVEVRSLLVSTMWIGQPLHGRRARRAQPRRGRRERPGAPPGIGR